MYFQKAAFAGVHNQKTQTFYYYYKKCIQYRIQDSIYLALSFVNSHIAPSWLSKAPLQPTCPQTSPQSTAAVELI